MSFRMSVSLWEKNDHRWVSLDALHCSIKSALLSRSQSKHKRVATWRIWYVRGLYTKCWLPRMPRVVDQGVRWSTKEPSYRDNRRGQSVYACLVWEHRSTVLDLEVEYLDARKVRNPDKNASEYPSSRAKRVSFDVHYLFTTFTPMITKTKIKTEGGMFPAKFCVDAQRIGHTSNLKQARIHIVFRLDIAYFSGGVWRQRHRRIVLWQIKSNVFHKPSMEQTISMRNFTVGDLWSVSTIWMICIPIFYAMQLAWSHCRDLNF